MKKTLEPYQLIERSIIKKYRKELWTPFIVAVKRYELVQAGDHIAVCISGGKDSMLMAKLMPPKLHSTSFPGMTLIRPMYCIREEDILAWKRYNELEFIQCACRFTENCTMCDNGGGGSKRQEIKTLLRRLKRENPNIENSIFRSIHAVALDTMPGYKSEGVEHSFLERFNEKEQEFHAED